MRIKGDLRWFRQDLLALQGLSSVLSGAMQKVTGMFRGFKGVSGYLKVIKDSNGKQCGIHTVSAYNAHQR